MSGISTGTGIFSGINTQSLISQLLQVEARPRQLAQQRLNELQTQRDAIRDINSALLGLEQASAAFNNDNIFQTSRASSSNPDVLTASAGANATLGNFNFVVDRLVGTQQEISRGFADQDTSGIGAEQFTFEIGGGRLDTETELSELNGGAGVDRGVISVTDADGNTAEIDLSTAVTVDEVLDAINSNSAIDVTASADGTGLRLENVQSVSQVGDDSTASDLGIAGSSDANDVIEGQQIFTLSETTSLASLNDGNGVAFEEDAGQDSSATADFQIVVDDGAGNETTHSIVLGETTQTTTDPETGEETTEVVQTAVSTLGDVIDRIESETEGAVNASISDDGTSLVLEAANAGEEIRVEEGPTGRPTAEDLGLLDQPQGASITSSRLLAGINTTLVSNLNGGSGLTADDIQITAADGTVSNITIDTDGTVAGIIDAINDQSGGTVAASLNDSGNGITVVDNTGGGGSLEISGGAADELNITGSSADGQLASGNLQTQFVSEATLLADLNAGQGIGSGEFTITDSSGGTATVNIDQDDTTVRDVLQAINNASGADVLAEINPTGDGIILRDEAGGDQALNVSDDTGQVARNLNLLGDADFEAGDPASENIIDGSFERAVDFESTDTLQDVADKINAADVGVDAAIINDGGSQPFRLTLTSEVSGSVGEVLIDTGGFDLGLETLSQAQDSVVFFGSEDPADGVALTSSSNTLDSVINGVTIDLNSTSDSPVQVTVSRDTGAIEGAIQNFVDQFNGALERLDFHGRFDQETEERGALLGDSILGTVRRTLLNTVQGEPLNVDSQFQFLFEAGVSVGDEAKLEFDVERFRQAFEQDPQGVADLFAAFEQEPAEPEQVTPNATVTNTEENFTQLGVIERIEQTVGDLTDSVDGLLTRRTETFDNQIDLQEDRIETFNQQLEAKRARLEQQFLQMEQAIASLQQQQQALARIGSGGGGGGGLAALLG